MEVHSNLEELCFSYVQDWREDIRTKDLYSISKIKIGYPSKNVRNKIQGPANNETPDKNFPTHHLFR